MSAFDVIASTLRSGLTVDEVEFEVPGAPPAIAYRVGHDPALAQPVVIGLHDERGDKATLLADLEHLAARGFVGLAIDSPITRRAIADRDHHTAFQSQYTIADTALNLLQGDADTPDRDVALIGRGIGGEVAAALAADTFRIRAVAAIEPLPDRARFLAESKHPLAAGFRQYQGEAGVQAQVQRLADRSLITHLGISGITHWLLQIADDDDRLADSDHQQLLMSIPRTVRVDRHRDRSQLLATPALRTRVDFVSLMCSRPVGRV